LDIAGDAASRARGVLHFGLESHGHKIFTPALGDLSCPCELKTPAGLTLVGQNLIPWLAKASGIPETYLLGTKVHYASVAARMSWASHRSATRVEDCAYSLMGLFGINMPMLYGEGTAAFRRLQEEIMRNNDDSSIFCYKSKRVLRAHGSWS
jgi:hypothetical protein